MRDLSDVIWDMRNTIKPFVAKEIQLINYHGRESLDKAAFETEFEVILTLAEQAKIAIAKANPGWTPASDPPETEGQYLIAFKCYGSYVRDTACYSKNLYKVDSFNFRNRKGPGWYNCDSEAGYYECSNVRYWMPLPELPEQREGESK